MPLTVVVGGQYGSEGKGKLVSHLVCHEQAPVAVVRCGGSNAGHTAEGCGRRLMLRQLPSGAVDDRCGLAMAAGMQIDLELLLSELEAVGVGPDRLTIDPNATLIDPADAEAERSQRLLERIGSTLTGTGAAIARKVMRGPDVLRAADVDVLAPFLGDVSARLTRLLDDGGHVIVEGTQGAGLSLHHGSYPHVTGRDTTAAAFLSEVGLAPTRVDQVVVVLRTFPIRVAGESGPMWKEIAWEGVRARSGYPEALAEYTSVTGRLRRVGEFDWGLAKRAIRLNGPTAIALHGLDYVEHADLGCRSFGELSAQSHGFIAELEEQLEVPVRWLFTGPGGDDLIDRGPNRQIAFDARSPNARQRVR
ncbi:MAG: adenylosuccinate synthase [Solirubrobacteraceae bacterium]|jgi:adenylosuccinate synthase|nr:adenylosuccinate synthase [Solirubrobacteraceae bacterium]